MYQPLADLLRPQSLDDVFGQEHILGEGAKALIQAINIVFHIHSEQSVFFIIRN